MEYITEYIPYAETELAVLFEVPVSVENDSFTHEFGTESYPDHMEVTEPINWDRTKYTEEENDAIAAWLMIPSNLHTIETQAIGQAWDKYRDSLIDAAVDRYMDRMDD